MSLFCLVCFALVVCAFGVIFKKNHCQDQYQGTFPLYFLLGFLQFGIFSPFQVLCCECSKIRAQLRSFVCEHPVSQHHLLKKLSFPHWLHLAPLSSITWPYVRGFMSDPLVCMCVFIPVPHCFDYCSFKVWIQELRCLWLCSAFSELLWLVGASVVPYRF